MKTEGTEYVLITCKVEMNTSQAGESVNTALKFLYHV